MEWVIIILAFFLGAFFGIVFSGVLSASGMEADKEYFYNLGKEDARMEIENEKTV